MKIVKNAVAGTLESSDIFVKVEPAQTLEIEIESVVKDHYYQAIYNTVSEVLGDFQIKEGKFSINDRGALDCVIRARLETAVKRGGEDA